MNKIQVKMNKTLKLTNVLKKRITINEEAQNINIIIEQMQTYIKTKGVTQIGPLIQYSRAFTNDDGRLEMEIVIMLQCNNYIHNVEAPYSMDSIIRVSNAMYCRYMGPENKLNYAYDKINIEAFETDINLEDYNYTIFVDRNLAEDIIIVDVFAPKKDNS